MPINPWEETPQQQRWEELDLGDEGPAVKRLRVPGGWLYVVGKHPPVFVPG